MKVNLTNVFARSTVAGAALALAGCASYDLTPITIDDVHNPDFGEGYVFHAPAPYLIEIGGKHKIVYLPDFDRPYRFTRHEFLAKSELDVRFEDGWRFAGASSKTDSTAALSSLASLAGSLGIRAADGPETTRIYRIRSGRTPFLKLVYEFPSGGGHPRVNDDAPPAKEASEGADP